MRFLSSVLFTATALAAEPRVLRVCAEPNNLPFSNDRSEGFENRIAEVVAREMGAKLEFTWWSERKAAVSKALDEDRCDAWLNVPSALPGIATTAPYYRSTYVFLARRDRKLGITSLDDPRLDHWKIGIHVVGDGYAPPAHALARRGLAARIDGYSLFGAYGDQNPAARIVDAVAKGDVDVAIVWGPLAGYFAKRAGVPLDLVPVTPPTFLAVPFTYKMAAGVRNGNTELKRALDDAFRRSCTAIQAILSEYGVPMLAMEGSEPGCESVRPQSVSSR